MSSGAPTIPTRSGWPRSSRSVSARHSSLSQGGPLLGVVLSISLAGGLGCGGTAPRPPAPTPPPSIAVQTLSGESWGLFRSKRFDLALSLPDGKAWRIDDTSLRWLHAVHPATGSELLVRKWRDDLRSNHSRCETRARRWRTLPEIADAELVEQRPVPVPPGFDTKLRVGIVASGPEQPIGGVVVAFGGWSRQCFAYVFSTSARGRGVEEEIAQRLALMVEVLDQIEFGSDTTPAVGPELRELR